MVLARCAVWHWHTVTATEDNSGAEMTPQPPVKRGIVCVRLKELETPSARSLAAAGHSARKLLHHKFRWVGAHQRTFDLRVACHEPRVEQLV